MSSKAHANQPSNEDEEMKILIATDIHLGYQYNKKRGIDSDDSFTTFEEILQYGRQYEVDFILLGGDLFHDTRPSQTVLIKCLELLRKYCLGPREIKIEFLSDPNVIFQHCTYKTVNYEDPNLNICMPVFSIHGNHDDPSFGAIGSMDLMSVSGLINYFGKWTDVTHIEIPPLILKKGETHVALYGLSYINDQRLSRLIRDDKVNLLQPKDIPECFNIFVLHQNRIKHNQFEYVPQTILPKFLNLVIWGHEHECRITPEYVDDTHYYISQPGSSIATSLCESEATPKHIGILTVSKKQFKIKELKLETVRPFLFDNLDLREVEIPSKPSEELSISVYNFVDDYIENVLMSKLATQLSGNSKQPTLPLLRLRILYNSDKEMFDPIKLAQKYCDEVANPMEMVIFRKPLSSGGKASTLYADDGYDEMAQILSYDDENRDWKTTVQSGLKKYFSLEENKDKLTVLTVNGLNEALNRFVDGGDTDAFKDIVSHQMNKTIVHLETCEVDTSESIHDEIKNFRDKRLEQEEEEMEEMQAVFCNPKNKRIEKKLNTVLDENVTVLSDHDEDGTITYRAVPKKVRGTGKSRGSRGGGRGRGKTSEKKSSDALNTSQSAKIQLAKKRKQDQTTLQECMRSGQSENDVFVISDSD
ncbi:double strand break repair nuclease mre11 [Xylocopa sonorina]|uniref:double strand break repair nuclease mre11 n=1 Tax=Xylocopa sonorina TaxID=1818115 RepID=UPI00403A89B2